ncbi:hypothetical protein GN156_14875 [bacterium LRH843]|nr:hypothetical protein [bacterium LRH843]
MTNNGYTSTDSVHNLEGREKLNSTAWGGIHSPTPLFKNENKIIASIVHTNKNTVSSRTDISTEEELKEATNYEQVYIISIELK